MQIQHIRHPKIFGCCVDSKNAKPSRLHSVSKATKLNAKTTRELGLCSVCLLRCECSRRAADCAGGPDPEFTIRNRRVQRPESSDQNPRFHKRRTRKTNAMATKCCTVCLAIRTRPHTQILTDTYTNVRIQDNNAKCPIIKSSKRMKGRRKGRGVCRERVLRKINC